MSYDLQWLLLRKNNCFMVNRVREGPVFSKEPGNLLNLHSHKYSGLANAKTFHVQDTISGLKISSRKSSASPHAVSKGKSTTNIRRGSAPRRACGVAAKQVKRGYRPDLRKALLARVSALSVATKEKKPAPEKKPRGKKAKAAAAKAE